MLHVENLAKHFGGVHALDGCTLNLPRQRITGLIGPNGAGKTTLFNIIAGAHRPDSGRVLFNGTDVTGLPAHALFHRGLVRTFQIPQEFGRLTVTENLMAVPPGQLGEQLRHTWLARRAVRRQEQAVRGRVRDTLRFLGLDPVRHDLARTLSGGQKKLLELGRAMMADPHLLLLDEPGAGVNPTLLQALGDRIRRLNEERGYTICIIEHNINFLGGLCDRVIALAEGRVLAEGSIDELRANRAVLDAYLGYDEQAA